MTNGNLDDRFSRFVRFRIFVDEFLTNIDPIDLNNDENRFVSKFKDELVMKTTNEKEVEEISVELFLKSTNNYNNPLTSLCVDIEQSNGSIENLCSIEIIDQFDL